VQSLLADLDRPAVDAFLSAVDEVMNSNTFLLKVRTRTPVTPDNRHEVLSAFLRGRVFHEMMLQADQQRDWWMFHECPWQTPDPSLAAASDSGPWLVLGDVPLALDSMTEADFVARLRWMLCEAFSPYLGHREEARADEIIGAFVREVLGSDDRASDQWSFAAVEPDFLPSTEYYTGKPCPDLAYFDGGESDTATLAYRHDVLLLLLTNGSP
jgi:hypothetical protein